MHAFRRVSRPVARVLLVLYLPGCHHATPKGITPQEYIATRQPKRIRLTVNDSAQRILVAPSVVGDTIVGQVAYEGRPILGEIIRLAIADVTRFQVYAGRRGHPWPGALLGLLAGGAVGPCVAMAVSQCEAEDWACIDRFVAGAAAGMVFGAFAGAMIGELIKTDKWVEVALREQRR